MWDNTQDYASEKWKINWMIILKILLMTTVITHPWNVTIFSSHLISNGQSELHLCCLSLLRWNHRQKATHNPICQTKALSNKNSIKLPEKADDSKHNTSLQLNIRHIWPFVFFFSPPPTPVNLQLFQTSFTFQSSKQNKPNCWNRSSWSQHKSWQRLRCCGGD